MTPETHECLHSELLQSHSLGIKELETEIQFKKEKIDLMQMKIDKMDEKIDKINENVNKIILASTKQDNELELRLQTAETEIKNLKEELDKKEKEDNNRRNRQLVIIGTVFSAITIGLNIIFKFI